MENLSYLKFRQDEEFNIFHYKYLMLLCLWLLQMFDVWSTYTFIKVGADEHNVLVLFLINKFGLLAGLILSKAFFMIILTVMVFTCDNNRFLIVGLTLVVSVYMSFMFVFNFSHLLFYLSIR